MKDPHTDLISDELCGNKAPEAVYITSDAFEYHGEFRMIEPEGEPFVAYVRSDIVETLRADVARLTTHMNQQFAIARNLQAEIDQARAQLAAAVEIIESHVHKHGAHCELGCTADEFDAVKTFVARIKPPGEQQ